MKYTVEEFDRYLNAFEEGNKTLMNNAVALLTSGAIWSELCENISKFRKQSLVRKVLRHVAKTALRGSFEIDGLSVSQKFCEMQDGYPVSFGTNNCWTFWSHRLNAKIEVSFVADQVVYTNTESHRLVEQLSDVTNNSRFTLEGKIDIVHHFEDPRTSIL